MIHAAMKDDAFKQQYTKLGLTEADLHEAGDALPSLVNAAAGLREGAARHQGRAQRPG